MGFRSDPYRDSRVSIRSPHRSEGRCINLIIPAVALLAFQSAPLTGVRGDWRNQ